MKRSMFASPPDVHVNRAKAAAEAIKRRERDTIATAHNGQCRTAVEKLVQMSYWMGTLEAETRGSTDDIMATNEAAFEESLRRYTRARDAVLNSCTPPPPRSARRR